MRWATCRWAPWCTAPACGAARVPCLLWWPPPCCRRCCPRRSRVAQQFLPERVPSLKDLVLNAAGASAGALLAAAVQSTGWVDRWQALREGWFARDSALALLLLLLWPVALLFPAPVPLGLGHVWSELGAAVQVCCRGHAVAGRRRRLAGGQRPRHGTAEPPGGGPGRHAGPAGALPAGLRHVESGLAPAAAAVRGRCCWGWA